MSKAMMLEYLNPKSWIRVLRKLTRRCLTNPVPPAPVDTSISKEPKCLKERRWSASRIYLPMGEDAKTSLAGRKYVVRPDGWRRVEV